MTFNFYKYNDKSIIVNKRSILATLTPRVVTSDKMLGNNDRENPVLVITTDLLEYNSITQQIFHTLRFQ